MNQLTSFTEISGGAAMVLSQVLNAASLAAGAYAVRRPFLSYLNKVKETLRSDKEASRLDREIYRGAVMIATSTLVALLVLQLPIFFCIAFAAAAYFIALPVLRRRRTDRLNDEFDKALADSLQNVSSSLKAGLTLNKTLEIAVENTPEAFAKQIEVCLREYQLGLPLDEALDNIRHRVTTQNANIAFGAMIIGRKLGGPLPQILARIAVTIRERERVQGKLKTLTAQGRSQGAILCSAPILFAVMMRIFAPEKMAMLTSNSVGQVLFGIAIILEVTGIAVTYKMLQMEI